MSSPPLLSYTQRMFLSLSLSATITCPPSPAQTDNKITLLSHSTPVPDMIMGRDTVVRLRPGRLWSTLTHAVFLSYAYSILRIITALSIHPVYKSLT